MKLTDKQKVRYNEKVQVLQETIHRIKKAYTQKDVSTLEGALKELSEKLSRVDNQLEDVEYTSWSDIFNDSGYEYPFTLSFDELVYALPEDRSELLGYVEKHIEGSLNDWKMYELD